MNRRLLLRGGLAAFVVILVTAAAAGGWWCWALSAPRSGSAVDIEVPAGARSAAVAQRLTATGVVRSSLAFRLYLRLHGLDRRLKAGFYRVSPGATLPQVVNQLVKGESVLLRLTFPEGFTCRQVSARAVAAGLGAEEDYDRLEHDAGLREPFPWLPAHSLEGYLFPDTYLLPVGGSARDVVSAMLQRFQTVVVEGLRADLARSPLDLGEVVTLASLVEREAQHDDERAVIAGVLMRRLERGWKLECDATVLYALGRHKARVLYRDLQVDSPYNTYRYPGLPPGPIANPGKDCLLAALHPADGDAMYYVARPDGGHVFSRTLQEHQSATRRIRNGAG